MGYVELDESDCVVFVFPERLDAGGNPLRMRWWEAVESDLLAERDQRIGNQHPAQAERPTA